MAGDATPKDPKISLPEALIVLSFIMMVDLLELLLLFVGMDDFWITDALAFPTTYLYLRWKGVRGAYVLFTGAWELVPYLGWLPARTIGFLLTIWADRHPKKAQSMTKAATVARPSVQAPPRSTP